MNTRRDQQAGGPTRVDVRARGGSLAPGGVVGDGRYRLLAQFGIDERAGAHLWRARDGQLRRDVALTLLVGDPADTEAAYHARRTLERAAHAAKFAHGGVARVLDVLSLGNGISSSEGLLGIVVADWTKGTDLVDLVAERPVPPITAARMVQDLTETVDKAHQSGLVLGLDHPQRIRVTADGSLRLAFPGPLPDATLRDDVKAIGGVLYLLLTGRWALRGGPSAIPSAPHTPNGSVVPPRSLSPKVPANLSSLAVRTIEDGGNGGIRTASAILRMLDQAAEAEEQTQLVRQQERESGQSEAGDEDGGIWTTKKPVRDAGRRRKLALGVTVLAVAAVGILAWLGMMAISFFQDSPSAGGPPLNVARPQPSGQAAPPAGGQQGAQGGSTPLVPTNATVYNPEGKGDSPGRVRNVIDNNPATSWHTDDYKQQLPAIKTGLGVMASFDAPVMVNQINIDANSPGTRVEIRAADEDNPRLASTRVLGAADLGGPHTEVKLAAPQPSEHLLVWITRLGGGGDQFSSELGELAFLGTR